MKERIVLFKESPLTGGYSLAVRDDWVYKIKRVNISKVEKKLYEEDFGNKIITYKDFFEWWSRLNKVGKYANGEHGEDYEVF